MAFSCAATINYNCCEIFSFGLVLFVVSLGIRWPGPHRQVQLHFIFGIDNELRPVPKA